MKAVRAKEYAYLGTQAYFRTGAIGLPPERAIRTGENHLREFARSLCGRDSELLRDRTRVRLGALIGAQPEEIVFTKGTSEGIALLAHGLDLPDGCNVLAVDMEYPGTLFPWLQEQRLSVRVLPTREGRFSPEELFALADGKTRAIVLSVVQYQSGFLCDLSCIGAWCRERGILLLVDAIQGLGRIPVDVNAWNIDALACGGYKGLLGTFGVGFLYLRRDLMSRIRPFVLDDLCYDGAPYPALYRALPQEPLATDFRRMEGGSHNNYGIAVLDASVSLLQEVGVEHIRMHILRLEQSLRESPICNGRLLGGISPDTWSGNICLRLRAGEREKLERCFKQNEISVDLYPNLLRVGLHLYNTYEDVLRLRRVLEETL